jgi:hypothetical protein
MPDLIEQFRELTLLWKSDSRIRLSSSMQVICGHPAYREIVEMGEVALPLIFDELKRAPDHWFVALHEITGASPVLECNRGRMDGMTDDWLRWGLEHGYVGENGSV